MKPTKQQPVKREIKFRAWNKHNRIMRYPDDDDQIFISFDGNVYDYYEIDGEVFPAPEMQLMQFTGLRDKNGKGIYQGDILKIKTAKKDYGDCSYGGFAEVIGKTCGYEFQCFNPTLKEMEEKGEPWDSTSLWHISDRKYVEVIGNIYENPELLRKTK